MNKIERIALYSLFAVALILLTIFDFNISANLYNPDSIFGKIFYVGGQTPFLLFGSFACGLAYFFRPKQSKKASFWLGALFLFMSIGMALYSGYELSSAINRLAGKSWGTMKKILMAFPFSIPCFLIGFVPAILLRKAKMDEKEIFLFTLMVIFYAVYILVFTNLLKVLAYRPRFRLLASLYEGEALSSHWRPWYAFQTFFAKGNYAADLEAAGVAYHLDDFLSFPSGHTIVASGVLMIAYFPGLESKKAWLRPLCYAFGAVVGFSRIFLGDHNATDSLFGFYLGVAATDVLFTFVKPKLASSLERKEFFTKAS